MENTKERIIELMNHKNTLEKHISLIKNDIKAIELDMITTLSEELGIKIGHRHDKYSIYKFERVEYADIVDDIAISLYAQCYKLKQNGDIDRRVEPNYNIRMVGVLK